MTEEQITQKIKEIESAVKISAKKELTDVWEAIKELLPEKKEGPEKAVIPKKK